MDPKTVIRAGGGEFFTRLGVSDSIFLGGNPPFQPTANVQLRKCRQSRAAPERTFCL